MGRPLASVKLDDGKRKVLIDHLVGNCKTDPDDRGHYEAMSDATLLRLCHFTRNAAKDDSDEDDSDMDSSSYDSSASSMEDNTGKPDSSNADVTGSGAFSAAIQAGGLEDGKPVDGYKSKKGQGLGTEGTPPPVKDKGIMNELSKLPPHTRRVVENAIRVENQQKQQLAQRITANVADKRQRRMLTNAFSQLALPVLQAIVLCQGGERVHNHRDESDEFPAAGDFFAVLNNEDEPTRNAGGLDDALDAAPARMDYSSPFARNGGVGDAQAS